MTTPTRDLAGFEGRVRKTLVDATRTKWTTQELDEGLRQALAEYTRASLQPGARVKPRSVIGLVTPTVDWREVSLSTLTGLLTVSRVWFPYRSDAIYRPASPEWTEFEVWWSSGAATLYLKGSTLPDGVAQARVFYNIAHALKDLDGAAATTWDAPNDDLLVLGAAGWACVTRSVSVAEKTSPPADKTPNYKLLSDRYLSEFRAALVPRRVAVAKGLK